MMQQVEQGLSGDNGEQWELLLRQKRFALVLTGDDHLANRLLQRLSDMREDMPNGTLSPSALQFYSFKKLYELWMGEASRTTQVAHIFQPGRENEAIQKGLDPSIAKVMGGLPSLHRALLLLIYGEEFSYAATAQLLDITIEDLMTALAAARRKFSLPENAGLPGGSRVQRTSEKEVAHDAA